MLALGVLEISNVAMSLGVLDTGRGRPVDSRIPIIIARRIELPGAAAGLDRTEAPAEKSASKSRVRGDDRSAYMG